MAITSTPSWIAMSKAAIISAVWHEPGQQTLYETSREFAAPPLAVPFPRLPWKLTFLVLEPPSVVVVCVPWPSVSRGETLTVGSESVADAGESGDYAFHSCRNERSEFLNEWYLPRTLARRSWWVDVVISASGRLLLLPMYTMYSYT